MCLCPDYAFVAADRAETLTAIAQNALCGMFSSIVDSDDYCSSVDQANFGRIVGPIEDARAMEARVEAVAAPHESRPDRRTRMIAQALLLDVHDGMRIADEETFGPVLAVRPYERLADVVDYADTRPAPLVAYWLGPDDADSGGLPNAPAAAAAHAMALRHRCSRWRHRSVPLGAAAWGPAIASRGLTRSTTTAWWWAAICRSPSPAARHHRSSAR